ncbi:MAG: hypothetical protein MRY63_07865 [Neomegalonema sp.]|nr:hypothetical protein [Neomegalonema sp.]
MTTRCAYCDTIQHTSSNRCQSCGAGVSRHVEMQGTPALRLKDPASWLTWARQNWPLALFGAIFLLPIALQLTFALLGGVLTLIGATFVGKLLLTLGLAVFFWDLRRRRRIRD